MYLTGFSLAAELPTPSYQCLNEITVSTGAGEGAGVLR